MPEASAASNSSAREQRRRHSRHPTSCSVSTTNVADRVTHAVSLAMAELGDSYGMAECGGCLPPSSSVISGVDPRTGERFVNQLFLGSTAGPGTPYGDCWLTYLQSATAECASSTASSSTSCISRSGCRERRLLPDTEGAGRNRGASSLLVEFGPVGCSVEVGYVSDGSRQCRRGARGGGQGRRGSPQAPPRRRHRGAFELCAGEIG